ncbi:restriction endonuclease subunit S [Thiolapillus sp.]|uniref:restriction endonuclease subunit S n=1 Tax=Thiolapillus sp. TaxID=2017437 RepID=UPI003AF656ED
MGDEWSNQRLADVVELIGGGTPKRNHSDYWGGDIPWLSVRDFNNDNRYVYSTEETITEEGVKNSSTKILSPGQIIISARGTVGALAQLVRPMAFNQSCYGINAKDGTFNDYLFYLLKHTVANLQRITHGAVFDTITRETFQHVEIALPSLPEQRAIAHILGSLDDKIELNRQMAQTLESIARAIFKSWFVDFDPVKAKMEGKQPEGMSEEVSALFPDKFVESKLGMIPEGWASGRFSDISENIRINIRKDAINPNDCYIGLEHIPRKSLFLNNWGIGADVTSNKHRFLRYDLNPYFQMRPSILLAHSYIW